MKIKHTLFIGISLVFNSFLFSQSEFETTNDYIVYLNTNYRSNPNEAFRLLKVYLTEYEDRKEKRIDDLENIYYGLATYSQRSSNYDSCKVYVNKGLQLLERHKRIKGQSGFYNLLGVVHLSENKLDSSAHYFVKCIDALKSEEDFGKIPYVNNNIGNIYLNKEDYQQALVYFKRAYKDFDNTDTYNSRMMAPIFGNMALSYFKLDSIKQANKFANKAIELAENYDQNLGFINGYLTKSDIALQSKKEDSAKLYALKAYQFAKEKQDTYNIGVVAAHLASVLSQSNPIESITYGEIAYDIYTKEEARYLPNIVKILSEAYYNNNDFKNAAVFQKTYITYQDSLLKADYNKNTLDILEKYQASQKELQIKEQNLELTKKESQKNRFIIIAASLAAILLLLVLVVIQNRKTQRQKIINLENEKENIALKSLMAGEEKERSRIARELHDGIGSLIAASKMHASKLLSVHSEDESTLLQLLDSASKETRRISHNLLPESLINKGLDAALKDFINSINESQLVKADYDSINLSSQLPKATQLTIYRIVQELLNNIIKHSGATEAYVQLNQHETKLIITVEDNGKGFSYDKSDTGIGLQNIKSRLSLLNGTIEVDSKNTKGTSVYIEFELDKKHESIL